MSIVCAWCGDTIKEATQAKRLVMKCVPLVLMMNKDYTNRLLFGDDYKKTMKV